MTRRWSASYAAVVAATLAAAAVLAACEPDGLSTVAPDWMTLFESSQADAR